MNTTIQITGLNVRDIGDSNGPEVIVHFCITTERENGTSDLYGSAKLNETIDISPDFLRKTFEEQDREGDF